MNARIPEPCLCGASDCRSCGPAQGYRLITEEEVNELVADEVRYLRADPVAVGEALTCLHQRDYIVLDRLVFEAMDGERIEGFDPAQLQAIGQHLCDAVLSKFEEQARA